jgi:chemotaxis protein MotB
MEPLPWETDGETGMARQETWLLSFIDILALLLTLFVLLLALQDRGQPGAGDEAADPPPASPVFFSLLSLSGGPQLQHEASGYAMPGAGLVPMAARRDAAGDRQPRDETQAGQTLPPVTDDAPQSPAEPTGTATAASVAAPLPVDDENPDESVADAEEQTVASARPAAGARAAAEEQVTPGKQAATEEQATVEEPAESVASTESLETAAVTADATPALSPITPEAKSTTTRRAADRLSHSLQDSPLGERVEVIARPDAVNLVISDSILFAPASADLSTAGQALLGQLADVLRTLPYSVSVEGHTDNVPIHTPLYPSNWELSSARAASVTRRLIEQGVARERLRTVGYGDTRPRSDNATAEARAKNRRVTFVLRVEDPR